MVFNICWLLFLHFVADFLLQPREMGKKKSQELHWLLQHLIIQFFIVYIGCLFVLDPHVAFRLSALNAVVHGVIDWNIWRIYKAYAYYRIKNAIDKHLYLNYQHLNNTEEQWKYWEDHWFYATIGFDQLLHGCTLIVLLGWLA